MKKISWSVLLIFLTGLVLHPQTVYINPAFDSFARDHKELAIIPFAVTLKLKPGKMKKMEIEDLKKLEKAESEAMQAALYNYFLKQKEKDSIKINFQDIAKTNAMLAELNWKNDPYRPKNMENICRKLKVDGVISGSVITKNLLSDEAAAALDALDLVAGSWFGGRTTNTGSCTINLHDSKTGELLWQYERTLSRGMGSTTQSVVNAMMRKVSKNLPYEDIK